MPVNSQTLYDSFYHNVKLTDKNGDTVEGFVIFYESEYDSGYDEAAIALNNLVEYKESDIADIEILD
ncbi:hypothetical protein SAMN02910317_03005 [Ruminococcaceae bacterium FB2012]|nr:hypothetical protein SAMN02910317_03005 [Ruminococcaceae bacterium FB2012]